MEETLLVSLNDMKDYLGESGDDSDQMILDMILSAQEELYRATGKDFRKIKTNETAKRAVRMTVWLSFYADRDDVKNAAYIVQARDRLITQLQYGGDEEDDEETQDLDSSEE
jgi:hypothetical protein